MSFFYVFLVFVYGSFGAFVFLLGYEFYEFRGFDVFVFVVRLVFSRELDRFFMGFSKWIDDFRKIR